MPFKANLLEFTIRPMKPEEAPDVASLIFSSTNHWYESNGRGKIFSGKPEHCSIFTEVYEDLDPGCCFIAVSDSDQSILGSCFYHPRETHISLGIMNTRPDVGSKGVAKALLSEIVTEARLKGLPTRLVSSAFNLDSFSLYTRQGFAPYQIFQDMVVEVPYNGVTTTAIPGINVRAGTTEDAVRIDALERSTWQTSRIKDWEYIAENHQRIWSLTVAVNDGGALMGALASINHPGSELIGPGIATNEDVAKLMIQRELNQHRGSKPIVIIPSDKPALVSSLYEMGARNCELHVAQCLGEPPKINGVVMPTFLPETG